MRRRRFKTGDWIIYRKWKYTTHPGQRAREVRAAHKGDYYTYVVEKFWVVRRVSPNGELLVETRTGKCHRLKDSDLNLRRPTLWQRMRYRRRFFQLQRAALRNQGGSATKSQR